MPPAKYANTEEGFLPTESGSAIARKADSLREFAQGKRNDGRKGFGTREAQAPRRRCACAGMVFLTTIEIFC